MNSLLKNVGGVILLAGSLSACGGGGGVGEEIGLSNLPPIANAGLDQNVSFGSNIMLDASASYDLDGDIIEYSWDLISRPANSSALLDQFDIVNPVFVADVEGEYIFELYVGDGTADSAADRVTVTVAAANSAPVASAGRDQNVSPGSLVSLDGSASTDADGDNLSYRWQFITWPANSLGARLDDSSSVMPTFTPDINGTYILQLSVNDGMVTGTVDSIIITVDAQNSAPVANAGVDQNVAEGSFVRLDGTASSDADGDSMTYQWRFQSMPSGSAVTFRNDVTNEDRAYFYPDRRGTYVLSLSVDDGNGEQTIDTVSITAYSDLVNLAVALGRNSTLFEGTEVAGVVSIPNGNSSIDVNVIGMSMCVPGSPTSAPSASSIAPISVYGCENVVASITETLASDNSSATYTINYPELFVDISVLNSNAYIVATDVSYTITLELIDLGDGLYGFGGIMSENMSFTSMNSFSASSTVDAVIEDAQAYVEGILSGLFSDAVMTPMIEQLSSEVPEFVIDYRFDDLLVNL